MTMTENSSDGCTTHRHTDDGFEIIDVSFRVLIYRDEDEDAWIAVALEMDLRGYGDTKEAASLELRDLVIAQISFALHNNDPGMIDFPAELKYFEMFDQAQSRNIFELFNADAPSPAPPLDYFAKSLRIPPAHVIADMQSGSHWANG